MPSKTRPSITKRNREQARRDRREAKTARRKERTNQRSERPSPETGEDPDLAGIVPGPQSPPGEPGDDDSGNAI